MTDYIPRRGLRGGHWMTFLLGPAAARSHRLPRAGSGCSTSHADTAVLAHCYWQPDRQAIPLLIALHGLEGSSTAHYMRGLADKALRGRLQRRPAEPAQLRRHRAARARAVSLGPDARCRLRASASSRATDGIERVVVAGYSLGGNLALKLAGDARARRRRRCAACAPSRRCMELEACVRALERRSNVVYQWNFVRGLKARMRRKNACFPGRFDLARLRRSGPCASSTPPTRRRFFGFASAEDYYHRASAMRVVDRIRVPALIITAEDDPFVPAEPFRDPRLTRQPEHHGRRHAARRPLRLPRGSRRRNTTATGRSSRIVEFAAGACAAAVQLVDCQMPNRIWSEPPATTIPSGAALLSREVQHRQDAGVLRRALPHGRDQLHLLPDAQREAARRMGAGTPDDFTFTLKAPRRITHDSKLQRCEDLMQTFCRTATTLGPKLGVLLFQLPPTFKKDVGVLRQLHRAAARGHPRRLRVPPRVVARRRRSSTRCARRNLALCVADSEKMSTPVEMTADYAYFRLRDEGYQQADVERWAGDHRRLPACATRSSTSSTKNRDTAPSSPSG